MNEQYILSCESTVDMPYDYIRGRNIPVMFYSYSVDGQEYVDDMGKDAQTLTRFYQFLSDGKLPSTSQLNQFQYESYFDELLQKSDVLHIAFGSGMTGSVFNAFKAAEAMREKYPQRKLIVIDSMCSSSGYGLLVDSAADLRDAGSGIDEVAQWVEDNKKKVHHQFFSTDLKYFRRSGRVSGPAAMLGAVLGICPIMRLDDSGHIVAYDKVRGKKNAIDRTLDTMAAHVQDGEKYSGKCFITQSNCLSEAEKLRNAVRERFPNISGEIRICDIGTIIASHCGPGTVAVFFMGDERAPYAAD